MDKYSYISNADGSYIDDLYKLYKSDPGSIDETWQQFFEGFEFSFQKFGDGPEISTEEISLETKVRNYIYSWRKRGHLEATTNPVRKRKDRKALLELKDHGLSDNDLDVEFEVGNEIGIGRA